MTRPLRIDSHQHYWEIGRNGHSWPTPDLAPIHRDFLPDDLARECAPLAIDGTVAVQSQPDAADTLWLLDLAERTPSILGVVGWVDVKAPNAADQIASLAARPKLRGIRPMLQDLADDWILDPAVEPAIAAMIDHKLVFDALIRPRHMASIARFALAHPRLPIVIDHAAKPDIAAGERAAWIRGLEELAECPNTVCKLSGLVTEAAADWTADDVAPYVQDVLRLFGSDRVMWGSDWPVLLLQGSYDGWHELARDCAAPLGEAAMADIFGRTAMKVYGLSGRA